MTPEKQNCQLAAAELANEIGLQNVVIKFEPTGETGYLGVVFKLKITGVKTGNSESLSVVVKHVPLEEYHEKFAIYELYHVESLMYGKVFPIFDKLQEDAGIANKFKHAKVYKTVMERTKESIFMEDLCEKGYRQCAIGRLLDLVHAKFILNEMGKLHALCFAMKLQYPKEYVDCTRNLKVGLMDELKDPHVRKVKRDSIRFASQVIEDKEVKEKLLQLEQEDPDKTLALIEEETYGRNSLITHGDLWTNNALYKYKGDTLEEVHLLDWQTIRRSSPVVDVLFFLFTSVDPDVRSAYFQDLLEFYHKSVSSYLADLKCESDDVYNRNEFVEDLKKFATIGLTRSIVMLPVFANKYEDFNHDSKCAVEENLALLGPPIKSDTYVKQIRGAINDLINNHLF